MNDQSSIEGFKDRKVLYNDSMSEWIGNCLGAGIIHLALAEYLFVPVDIHGLSKKPCKCQQTLTCPRDNAL